MVKDVYYTTNAITDSSEFQLLRKVNSAFNKLDISLVEDCFDKNIVYESQWVLRPIRGKREVSEFLKRKFDKIKFQLLSGKMIHKADFGILNVGYWVVGIRIVQTLDQKEIKSAVLIKIKKSLIVRIDICMLRDPDTMIIL